MAQQQQNLSFTAPAFQGINTEESPLSQDITFAAEADNAVIDQFGRLGSRKGFKKSSVTYDFSAITPPAHDGYDVKIGAMHHSEGLNPTFAVEIKWTTAGNVTATNYYLATYTIATTTIKPAAASAYITADSMKGQFVTMGDYYYFVSANNPMLKVDPQACTAVRLEDESGFFPPQDDTGNLTGGDVSGDVLCSAYGRLWVTGIDGDYQTIWYSSLEEPLYWYDGQATPEPSHFGQNTGGSIAVSQFWPTGADKIQAIVAHNNMLVVFGRNSILFYGNPQGDPAAIGGIFLQDTVSGIGLVNRDAHCATGNDILFVDDTGVRSLGRSIQEQSVPIGDLTANVRTAFSQKVSLTQDLSTIVMDYWPNEGLAVCMFAETRFAYILDQRRLSSSGGARVTTWSDVPFKHSLFVAEGDDELTFMGSQDEHGLLEYTGGHDVVSDTFLFSYKSNPLTFGDSVRQKFPKRMDVTVISRDEPTVATARWGFGDVLEYSRQLTIDALFPSFYGIARYGQAFYGPGRESVRRYRVNTKGSGALVVLGMEATLNGGFFSIQEINIQTLLGRIY